MAGLAPANIRLVHDEADPAVVPGLSINHDSEDSRDVPQLDSSGTVVKIENGDGSVTVSIDGKSLVDQPEVNRGWFANLAETLDDQEMARVADDLLRGVEDDLQSRQEWVEERAQGIRLLGLKIEVPNISGAADGAPVEGMSRVRHPLLQEAVLRFQANARSEFLPTDGPVKIRDDGNGGDIATDQQANFLEKDLNHYLTVVATEYYPDTDKMLLMLGFGGTAFKKVYNCPLRNRPVSELVDANDLIVNNECTDLANAKRITHRSMMRPSTVKRLQILGAYRDIDLSTPMQPKTDAVQEAAKAQQGLTPGTMRPDDRDREVYEIYCELDLKGHEHKHRGKISGLEIPYRVTIDVSTKQVLSIARNYDEDTKKLPEARETFVKYTFVPGLGFYDIGLLNILGNTTNAVTAAWRELLDAGMFSNFPGFLMADTGARQNTNIFRVPPGGGALVKTGGLPINQAIMPLPYQPPSASLMTLVDNMVQTGQRVGGTAEMPVGEGRADVPVGTVLALIEQATKVLNSVHKRMHSAQAQEFRLLVRCFRENPEAFWQKNKKPATKWDEQTFLAAINANELTPQADPNTASYGQRVMKIMALKQLQQANPSMYDPIAIDMAALNALGFSNPQQFMAPPAAQAAPPPELLKEQAETQAKTMMAQAAMLKAQAAAEKDKAQAASVSAETQNGLAGGGEVGPPQDSAADTMNAEANKTKADAHVTVAQAKATAELINAHTNAHKADTARASEALSDANAADDRKSQQHVELLHLARDIVMKGADHSLQHGLKDKEIEAQQEAAKVAGAAELKPKKGKKDT